MTNEINELIQSLQDGSITLDEVASNFRERSWPRRETLPPSTYLELAAAAQQDPEPYLPDSFDDVTAAHQEGRLTDEEYEILSRAAADAKRAQDLRNE